MASASKKAMEQLHAALAKEMAGILENGVKEMTKDGEVVTVTPAAGFLNAVRQFLKDNGIEAQAGDGKTSDPFNELKNKALPFLSQDDEDAHVEH